MNLTMICTRCAHLGETKTVTKGSFLIELALWLCFLFPGLIYSIWRLTSRHQACQSCGAAEVVPANSPAGVKLFRETRPDPGAAP